MKKEIFQPKTNRSERDSPIRRSLRYVWLDELLVPSHRLVMAMGYLTATTVLLKRREVGRFLGEVEGRSWPEMFSKMILLSKLCPHRSGERHSTDYSSESPLPVLNWQRL